jgi:predicted ATPase/class 3 adenylate cyclase
MATTPPAGTVTLLFTDIEGSTRLLQQLGARYEDLLREHDRLLRDVFGSHGGFVVGTQGDAFFVAFPTGRAALEAAVAAQRALAAHDWAGGSSVRVRMGIHTGEPTVVGSDYVGLDVHRAARIASAAHGGQVLVSGATYEVGHDDLPPGASLRDLGAHRLKDLDRAEHLYQLLASGLERRFPAPRTLEAPLRLPVQLTSFVGRERARSEVGELLGRDDVRLVTLTGPGGTGKTRLAVQVAAEARDQHPDGVFFVALSPLAEPGLVPATIAEAVGVRETGGRDPLEALEQELADKRLLLVLDNFEHVLDAAPIAGRLLAAAPGLRVLATSRAGLRLSGEHEYQVPPLSLPDGGAVGDSEAAQLFVARARAARPGFELTPDNAAAVGEICARLDGLPLAIELAAARTKVLAPQAILPRLERRLHLLTGGPSDVPARQKTLRGAIDWSYDLLEEEEQRFFRGLAVFAGGWALEAAEAVVGEAGGLDSLDMIASLLDKSLVWVADSSRDDARYSMLKTIAEYAADRLEGAGEAEDARARHASFFLAVVEAAEPELLGPDQVMWGRRLQDDHDNVRAALRWATERAASSPEAARMGLRLAGAFGRFWYTRGLAREGCRWLDDVLAHGPRRGPERANALHIFGVLLDHRGEHERAREAFGESLELYRELGEEGWVARSLNSLGVAARSLGQLQLARDLFAESLEVRRRLGETSGVTSVLGNLACVEMDEGNDAAARRLFEESLTLDERLGNTWGVAVNKSNLSVLALETGDLDEARGLVGEALDVFSDLGDTDGVAECLERTAAIEAAGGDASRAARLVGAARALRDRIDSPLVAADERRLERHLGPVRVALGETGFGLALAEGRTMTLPQAIAHARRGTRP